MTDLQSTHTEPEGLPADVAERVRALADQLHDALRNEMVREHPAPEVRALWQAAKMVNAAAGGLDNHVEPETTVHTSRWVEVAFNASDIADTALRIAGSGMSLADARAHVERADINTLDVPFNAATAFAARVELIPAHDGEDYAQPVTVAVTGDPERTLTVAGELSPRPYAAAGQLLRVVHHLDRLGAALGDVVIAPIDKPAT
ncbi:hypothetical protein AB0B10_25200 [Micromonospora arborensis]|uniref:hypothetical protein n=1 Tax=Micromonospora arborensis TaxID=2116518 RepID=UPI0033E89C45